MFTAGHKSAIDLIYTFNITFITLSFSLLKANKTLLRSQTIQVTKQAAPTHRRQMSLPIGTLNHPQHLNSLTISLLKIILYCEIHRLQL